MSLTKIDTINSVYNQLGISKKDCVGIVENIFEIIKDELDKGNPVKITFADVAGIDEAKEEINPMRIVYFFAPLQKGR
jgi:hypothetical protein